MLKKLFLLTTLITFLTSTTAWSVPLGGPGKANRDRISGTLEVAGRVGIGTAAPGSKLTVAGTIETTLGGIKFPGGSIQTVSASHSIGESYGGGIVFYVYDNGRHGLIAARADQSPTIVWSSSLTSTCARADGVGAGLKNTAIIIANQGPVDGDPFAATVCNEYSTTEGGVTYDNWYLPSKHELNLLYLQKAVVGGFDAIYPYWSSTEKDFINAWYQDLNSGNQGSSGKHSEGDWPCVRAIRAF